MLGTSAVTNQVTGFTEFGWKDQVALNTCQDPVVTLVDRDNPFSTPVPWLEVAPLTAAELTAFEALGSTKATTPIPFSMTITPPND